VPDHHYDDASDDDDDRGADHDIDDYDDRDADNDHDIDDHDDRGANHDIDDHDIDDVDIDDVDYDEHYVGSRRDGDSVLCADRGPAVLLGRDQPHGLRTLPDLRRDLEPHLRLRH